MLSRFKQLYKKYTGGNIQPEEFKEMHCSLESVSDDNLWTAMLESADDAPVTPMPQAMKNEVKRNLRRSVISQRIKSYARYAAAVIALIFITSAVILGINAPHATSSMQEFTASIPAGSRTNLTLPDGTRVQLNAASELTFGWDTKGERVAHLCGEAFFDVAKDPDHAFRVIVSDVEIEVHGTSFNVNAYDNKNISVALVNGKVSLCGSGLRGNAYIMQPGEKAVYNNEDRSFSISRAEMNVETGWTRGNLVFKHKKLSEVIAMVERRYGVEIEMQCDSLSDDTLTGKFGNEDITDVLSSLSNMYKFKYTIKKNHITIY